MTDLIDRQAAIALAKDICVPIKDGTVYKHRCIDPDEIRELPSVEAEPVRHGRWIPVSEQLPEDEQEVLFSTKTGRVHLGRYHNDNSVNQWYSFLYKMRACNNIVNAWMPLPEPYKDGEQNG